MASPQQPDELLTRQQVADRLKLKVRGVDGLVKRELLTCIRLGRKCMRFRWSDVQADMARVTTLSVGSQQERKARTLT